MNLSTIFGPDNLVQLVQYQAWAQPNEPAFIYLTDGVDNEIVLTNAQLDRRARRVAAFLQKQHLFAERALLLYPPGLDFIIAYFGCLYAGVIAVPVYPPRKNRAMLRIQAVEESAKAKIVLATADIIKRSETMLDDTPALKSIPWIATDKMTDDPQGIRVGMEDDWHLPAVDHETLAFLQYTSGSTGDPKGVMLTHGNLLHNSRLICQGFEHTRSGTGVFWLPSYHDMGLIGGIIQPLYVGRPNVIMSPLTFLMKPFRWLAAITKYKGTTCGGPNFAYDLCVRQITEAQIDQLDLSSWRVAFNGAEPVLAETLETFAQKFERCGFRYEMFYPCFGLAEGTLIVTGGYVSDPPVIKRFDTEQLEKGVAVESIESSTVRSRRLVSSGKNILPDQKVVIVNPQTCAECPEGTVGEIWVTGPSVAQGYWERPDITAYTFHAKITDWKDSPNFMRTGDLGFLSDGELFVTGRIKDLIIVRGVNLYPQDIERTVQNVDPVLRPLCGAAVMLQDQNGKERLVIVQEVERRFKGNDEAENQRLFEAIRKTVAAEFEVPVEGIALIQHGSIPKTSSGKVQHFACRDGFIDGSLSEVVRWESFEHSTAKPVEPSNERDSVNPALTNKLETQKREALLPAREHFVTSKPGSITRESDSAINEPDSVNPVSRGSFEMLSESQVAEAVLEEVRRIGKDRASNVTLATDITELGLDSLERMEIIASLEDRFGGQFPESILPELLTAQQVLDAVLQHLGRGIKAPPSVTESAVPLVTEDAYDIAQFPEYQKLKGGLQLMEQTGLNRFFDVHEGITNNIALIGGKEYINFSNYNYINTSGDPEVTAAAVEACKKYGTSVSASRIVSGNKPIHRELENEITDFLGTEDTVVMVGGHSTNEGVIGHLLNEQDMILFDSLSHNSIMEGALLSGARRRPFPHNDWEAADWILQKHRKQYRRVLLAVEGLYSMDGDYPNLPEFIKVKKNHHTLLMVDEAHSLGTLGKTGRGIGEHFGVKRSDVDIWMCTLSKTFASVGGYISGSKELIEYLKYTSPNFVFSVGISPPMCAAALAAIRVLKREPERTLAAQRNGQLFLQLAKERNLNTGVSLGNVVVPVIIGNSLKALQTSRALFDKGINVQPILHPAVEEKAARLRFFITSAHTEEQIRYTVNAVSEELNG